jgi:hypothetical protein
MHPARKAAALFLFLAFLSLFAGLLYGAITTGEGAARGGWAFVILAGVLVVA